MKLLETETVFAFMDIGPIAKGHCLVIPKCKSSISLARLGRVQEHARDRIGRREIRWAQEKIG